MSKRFRTFQWEIVAINKLVAIAGPSLIIAKPVSESTLLSCASQEHAVFLEQGVATLIANVEKSRMMSRDGPWRYQRVSIDSAMKLCAFLDQSTGVDFSGGSASQSAIVRIEDDIGAKNIERWLISAVLERDPSVELLLALIRTLEPYRLVRFLLREHAQAKTVATLGERYGLSKSHFNRLCRQVLGNGVKHELRLWRAAEAMLDVFDRREAMTTIAYGHGFSSPSHFSREIKQLFGISPRRFHVRLG